MRYKTILVHLSDERRTAELLAPAFALAERSNGHVIGIAALPRAYVLPAGAPGVGDTVVIDAHRKACAEEAERIRAAFAAAATGRALIAEWRLLDDEAGRTAGGAGGSIIEHARAADLVIAGREEPGLRGAGRHGFGERLVLESGRPVLLIPPASRISDVGTRPLVAWNGTREAARAAFDALPLLAVAERTHIVRIVHGADDSSEALAADGDLAAALTAHGVRCSGIERRRASIDAGSALLAALEEHGCDLLVMGGYGHSRMRELVLGGATWHMLHRAPVPVLISH